jgi:hypothetical protein
MSLIYEPSGKAREYSPLALNIYSGGCDHGCKYCYCKQIQRGNWSDTGKPRSMKGLENEASKAEKQILLSFIGDPYCSAEPSYRATRQALSVLSAARCSVAVLTKGGCRCLDDLDMFRVWPDHRFKIGATLTFISPRKSLEWEPGAALPQERIETLKALHSAGVHTWASIEPVIDPAESLAVIEASLPYVDGYKVGKLNHMANSTDWKAFCMSSVSMIREAGKALYVKNDLRPFAPAGFLSPSECNSESMFLPDRPSFLEAKVMLPGFG